MKISIDRKSEDAAGSSVLKYSRNICGASITNNFMRWHDIQCPIKTTKSQSRKQIILIRKKNKKQTKTKNTTYNRAKLVAD